VVVIRLRGGWDRVCGRSWRGCLAVVVLSIGTDIVLHKLGIFPPLGQKMADRTVYGIIGSYLRARLARIG
jgi:hypothetical protein